jgi:hypothetical protein
MCMGFAAMAIIFVVHNYLIFQLFKTLETRFPELWAQLGKPSLIMNNSISNNLAIFSFLWNKKYRAQNDALFSKQCDIARFSSIFSVTCASIWVMFGLIYILLIEYGTTA